VFIIQYIHIYVHMEYAGVYIVLYTHTKKNAGVFTIRYIYVNKIYWYVCSLSDTYIQIYMEYAGVYIIQYINTYVEHAAVFIIQCIQIWKAVAYITQHVHMYQEMLVCTFSNIRVHVYGICWCEHQPIHMYMLRNASMFII
jgi:hypothetical protein